MKFIEMEREESRFVEAASNLFPEAFSEAVCMTVDSEEFDQGWPNSAGGFCRPGTAVCDVLIHERTAVVKLTGLDGRSFAKSPLPELNICGVFFDGKLAYAVLNPDDGLFLEDLRKKNPASVGEAATLYGNECEEIWVAPAPPRRKIKVVGNNEQM